MSDTSKLLAAADLADRYIETILSTQPDLLVGTSAGVLNAAFVAEHGLTSSTVDRLEAIWRSLRARDVFPPDPLRLIRALRG